MKFHSTILLLFFVYIQISCSHSDQYIEPTGTYTFNPKVDRNKLPINSYFGDIQVLKLSKSEIVVTFFICKGAPSYNIGTFIDTLKYKNNSSIFKSDYDSTCSIELNFKDKEIAVNQRAQNINSACGFGHGVVAKGLFEKQSDKEPTLINPVTGEELE